mmetsp:Transcript_1156/g.1876  ORF Transcript_1156/g.1876 Transcript_1156/m.1876 type:complete len:222 (-) Transcript_1156:169-834(-)
MINAIAPTKSSSVSQFQFLMHTVKGGNLKSIVRLLKCYGYTSVLPMSDSNGSTVLHVAAKSGNIEVMNLILSYNLIDVNKLEVKTSGGYAAIHHICHLGNIICLDRLIQAGASVNIPTQCDMRLLPLHICCRMGHTECARKLVAHGADVNAPDGFGHNPSFWAYSMRHMDLIRDVNLPPSRVATAAEHLKITGVNVNNFKKVKKKAVKSKKSKPSGKKRKT